MVALGRPSLLVALAACAACAACARRPVRAPLAVVPETTGTEVRLAATPGSSFGDMVAVGVGLSSGAPATYLVSGAHIYAIDRAGRRVAPLRVDEAVRVAGGATALIAGLQGAGGGALLAGLTAAIPGAIFGAVEGGADGAGAGAAVGAGVGFVAGAVSGFFASKAGTETEITEQLHSLALRGQALVPGVPVSGFVFYPRGEYVGVRAILIDQRTKGVVEVGGRIVGGAS